jgi:pimeloyl-ACP methyl ester carboxylesterase
MDARVSDSLSSKKSTNDRAVLKIPAGIRFGFQTASSISPSLGAMIAQQLFFHPPRGTYRDEQKAVLARARTMALPVRGRPVETYVWGEGPAVLLIHGWGGHAGHMTEFVAPLTKAGYRVIALDAPGHGRSPGRLSSIVHFADAIRAVAETSGPLHAVIAHSMGAAATTHLLGGGLTLKRAVFLAPQARLTGYWALFRNSLGMSDRVWQLMRTRTERWLNVRYDQLHPEVAAPRMTTPLLILHGHADRMTPVSEGQTLAKAWPSAEILLLDGGHLGILRDWHALLAATEFVRG